MREYYPIKQLYHELGERNFSGQYLRNACLENGLLPEIDLSQANLENAECYSSYLIRANFNSTNLSKANLSNQELRSWRKSNPGGLQVRADGRANNLQLRLIPTNASIEPIHF